MELPTGEFWALTVVTSGGGISSTSEDGISSTLMTTRTDEIPVVFVVTPGHEITSTSLNSCDEEGSVLPIATSGGEICSTSLESSTADGRERLVERLEGGFGLDTLLELPLEAVEALLVRVVDEVVCAAFLLVAGICSISVIPPVGGSSGFVITEHAVSLISNPRDSGTWSAPPSENTSSIPKQLP